MAKKTEYKYVNLARILDNERTAPGHYRGFTCVVNMGGGIRRAFYAEWVQDLGDPPGPMARHVMRATRRAQSLAAASDPGAPPGPDDDLCGIPMPVGDYVVYSQEIVDTWVSEELP